MQLALNARTQPLDLRRVAVMVAVGSLLGLVVLRAVSYAMQPDAVMSLLTQSDHSVFERAAERIRAGGPLYQEWQLTRSYSTFEMADLYPPPAYIFIVAMSFLPAFLWWAIPLGIIAATVWYWRPSLIGWAAILACFAPPWAWDGILSGGMFMWIAAAIALGTRWPVFYVAVLVKPTLLPFALLGIRSRWWWAAAAFGVVVSLAMLPLWFDFVRAVGNMRESGLLYSVHNIPLLLVPLVARLGRMR